MLLAMLIVSLVALAFTGFLRSVFQSSIQTTVRTGGQNISMGGFNQIEQDFFDMNEIVYAAADRIDFYMDSHRKPDYNPDGHLDGDGVPNAQDPDDDGDALDAATPITRLRDLLPGISTAGWRMGFDLDDDDENNDGKRDVLCRYQYFPGDPYGRLERTFCFDEVCGEPQVILEAGLRDFKFDYFGSLTAPDLPSGADLNGDGMIDRDDLDRMDGVAGPGDPAILNNFVECRWITGVRVHLVTNPSTSYSSPVTLDTEMTPPLLVIKRKYP